MSLPETYKAVYSLNKSTGKPELKELPLQKPGKNQVLIKVEYAPINPTDLLLMSNFYTPGSEIQNPVGSEGSGIIVAVGESLQIPFKVGDRVHFMLHSWGQYALLDSHEVFPVQEGLALEDAASHFINPATVYYMGQVAQQGGHKAAIHTAGASALGKMLIKYFKHLGIKLINVVRREEYVEELKKEGADYVLNSQDPDFEKKLTELAEKENATMALEAVAGEFTRVIVRALPRNSVCYLYGVLASPIIQVDVFELLKKKRVEGLIIYGYAEELKQKGEFRSFLTEVHKFLPTAFSSKVQKIFKLEEFEKALEHYHKNSSKGKVLLKLN